MKIARAHTLPLPSRRLLLVVVASIFVALASTFAIYLTKTHTDNAYATLAGFDAGNIMDDAVMSNKDTMTESQIQSFLDSKNTCKTNPKNPYTTSGISVKSSTYATGYWGGTTYQYHLKDYKFICMADQDFDGESAAHIIYSAAQDYNINPQVLIVLLQKENSLVTDNWPNYNVQYATATGYACPDSGPNNSANCNSNYFGFKNQVRNAANMFHTLLIGYGVNNYPIGNNTILYNPSRSCGSSVVNVKNRATGALYTYTPYQPNTAALKAVWGEAPCGAYGNRNFYNYFTDWFGSTRYTIQGAIGQRYTAIGGRAKLGLPISNEASLSSGGKYQNFNNGVIYWKSGIGAWEITGSIGDRYTALKADTSTLGYPTSGEYTLSSGAKYQQFEGGRIYWKSGVGAKYIVSDILECYTDINADRSRLGIPTGDAVILLSGGIYQQFERGRIYWSASSGAWDLSGSIGGHYYDTSGGDTGTFGYPTSGEITLSSGVKYQDFEGGRIYWKSKVGIRSVIGAIGQHYIGLEAQKSRLRLPVSNEKHLSTGGVYQQFEGGRIYWKSKVGAFDVGGSIGNKYYNDLAADESPLGYPAGNETALSSSVKYQQFEGGRIYWKSKVGTYSVYGAIGAYYSSINMEESRMRLPKGNEKHLSTGGVYQQFEGGRIYWKSKVGAFDVGGSIGNTYYSLGADKSKLGYPISPEVTDASGAITQQYQHGSITYKDKKVTYKIS